MITQRFTECLLYTRPCAKIQKIKMNKTIQIHEGLKLKEIYSVKQLKCSL